MPRRVFIDTSVFIAFHNRRDVAHERAMEIVRSIARGEFGAAYTSDYVFDEAVTFTLARTGSHGLAESLGALLLGDGSPVFARLLNVDEDAFRGAWDLFRLYDDSRLSFTDCTSLELMRGLGIEQIASFDSGFDVCVKRIC